MCIRRLLSGLESERRPGDLGGLVVLRPREKMLKVGVVLSQLGAIGTVVVLPGVATSRKAKGSFDLVSKMMGDEGSLMLLSQDTTLEAELYELKL